MKHVTEASNVAIVQKEKIVTQALALKQWLVEEGRGIQPAPALQISEKTSIEAENPGHDFVPMINSVKGCLRQGIMDLAPADDTILSSELLNYCNRMHRDI